MKTKGKELKEKRRTSGEPDENQDNAGNQFSGCKCKKQKKRSY